VSEKLELVRSIYAAWERGDFGSADWANPEIEFEMRGGLTTGIWRGVAEMSDAWTAMLRAWDDLRAVPEEFRELDDDRVLVFLRNTGRGRGSGIEVGPISTEAANLFTVRDGRVTRLVLYWNREDAIAELGLAEPDEATGS
jgi:ketosteroid isomerase-like protein